MQIDASNRRRLKKAQRDIVNARGRLETSEKRLTELQSGFRLQRDDGASRAVLDRLKLRIARMRAARDQLRTAVGDKETALLSLRGKIFDRNPSRFVEDLKADNPIAMLPVRLEYRFFVGNQTELKIRIYPQELHIDDHQQSLSTSEIEAGRAFWTAVLETRVGGGDEKTTWQALARQHGAGRARWIADQLKPQNFELADPTKPLAFPDIPAIDDSALDATVRCLPEKWVVLGYRAGKLVVQAWGRPIDGALTVNLTDAADDDDAPDENTLPRDDDAQPPQAKGLDWIVNYDTALNAGMAITLTTADDADLAKGYDELIVLGVDWLRDEEEGAAAFEALLTNHQYEQGLELPAQAEPTNLDEENADSAATAAGFVQRQTDKLNPLVVPVANTPAGDGALLNDGLGLSAGSPLLTVPGSERRLHQAQANMQTALFEGTLGYFADQMLDPMLSDADIARLKNHSIRFIRPLGAMPLLRVGDQPYGILPVCDGKRFTAANRNIGNRIQTETNSWRGYWQNAARRSVPRIGKTDDVDDDMLNALWMSARATDFRIREVIGPTMTANFANVQSEHVFQEAAAKVLMNLGNYKTKPFLADATLSRLHHRARVPFIQRGNELQTLAVDYLSTIADQTRSTGGFKDMLQKKLEDPDSVLEAIVTYSALLELAKGAARLSTVKDAGRFKFSRLAARDQELNNISDGSDSNNGISLVSNALARQPAVTNNRTVVDEVARLLRDSSASGTIDRTVLRPAREFENALRNLSTLTVQELEILLTGSLDSLSHRLDCWMSSLANQRLDELRRRNKRGLYLGGFGWLDDVKPASQATGFGMSLAPSINHAKAAAVLKSAHAAHAGDDKKLLSVDLSSARVRAALSLIEGVRQGQSTGALLGYRFERDLKRRRLSLVQFIGVLRQIAPLGRANVTLPDTPLESIETREVVDGVRLIELWRESKDFFAEHRDLPQGGQDQADLKRALDALEETLDALNDLMLAESVYQYVNGNSDRASAALDSLERQSLFPEPEIAATPHSAAVYHHRVLVTLDDKGLPSSWGGLPPISADPRARVDPRLNAWLAELFGDPDKYQFSGTLFADFEDTVAGVTSINRREQEKVTITLRDLKLHPSSIVAAATTPSADKPSELEARIERVLKAKLQGNLPTNAFGTRMVINGAAVDPTKVGFDGFSLLVEQMANLLGAAEVGDATNLASEDMTDAGLDVAEFAQRVQAVHVDFGAAAGALDLGANHQALRARLTALADHGVQNALPTPNNDSLQAQAEMVERNVQQILQRLGKHRSGFVRSQANALEQIDHDRQTLKIIYGESFVAIPLCLVPDPQKQNASLGHAKDLLPNGSIDVEDWLQLNAMARPSVARLTNLLSASAIVNIDETPNVATTNVIQLPHNPDERWVGLPLEADFIRPKANLSILVYHTGEALNLTSQKAVLAIDAWADSIPDASQDAAVTFQYDAPNAQAPQTVLLAVPPLHGQRNWTFDDIVGAVREAKDLAEIRMADLAHLDILPRMLPALYFPFDLEEESIGLHFGHTMEFGNLMSALK